MTVDDGKPMEQALTEGLHEIPTDGVMQPTGYGDFRSACSDGFPVSPEFRDNPARLERVP